MVGSDVRPGGDRGGSAPRGSAPRGSAPRGTIPATGWGLAPASAASRQAGSLEVRLAESADEIRRAQRLRYQVFFEEMSGMPGAAARLSRRDADPHDAICDHLLVLDHGAPPRPFRAARPRVVGTYRLLRQEKAGALGFYSAAEYEVAGLLAAHPRARFLELGRSCVLAPYRNRGTVELLWRGIWDYVLRHRLDVLVGCASLAGTDPVALAPQLSVLFHHARAPEPWRVRARPELHARMDLISREALDARAAVRALPPLIRGYLRLGATFGDGAVVDRAFGTTDVFTVLPVGAIAARYLDRFGPPGPAAASSAAA